MKTFYFTGTGNCLQVARVIGAGGELISIPKFLRGQDVIGANRGQCNARERDGANRGRVTVSDDKIGLVFPTYWLTVPDIVAEFLSRTQLESNYIFAVTTCGNSALTLKSHLLQLARRNGFKLSYFAKLSMPDNYLPGFDMVKQKRRFKDNQLADKIGRVAGAVHSGKVNVSGLAGLSFLRSTIQRVATKQLTDFQRRFTLDVCCDGCAICAGVCPTQNIELKADAVQNGGTAPARPAHGSRCCACLACAHACPRSAIHVAGEKNGERYRNPTVSIRDIIQANGQGQPEH